MRLLPHNPDTGTLQLLCPNCFLETQEISEVFTVPGSGAYFFLIVSCDYVPKADKIFLDGVYEFRNPYGFLPASEIAQYMVCFENDKLFIVLDVRRFFDRLFWNHLDILGFHDPSSL